MAISLGEIVLQDVEFSVQGQSLTGILSIPEPSVGCGAVILHPHPLFGGDMENIVVRALNNILLDAGHATLRFNFRGTEREDLFAGVEGAVEDARAGLSTLLQHTSIRHAGAVGYSFGGSVALSLALRKPLLYLVTLSASLDILSEGVNDVSKLKEISCPVLLFHGDKDIVIPKQDIFQLASMIGNEKVRTFVLENEGHFYNRSLTEVQKKLKTYLGSLAC